MGDWLLDRWDGVSNDLLQRGSYLMLPTDYTSHLGAIFVKVELGIPLPLQPGTWWAYLIPLSVPVGHWTNSPEVVAVKTELPPRRAEEVYEHDTPASVRFQSLTPGDYRLKLVWERHPPAGVWRTNI